VQEVLADATARVDELTAKALAMPLTPVGQAALHVTASKAQPSAAPAGESQTEELTYIAAVNAALRDELASDPRTVVYGEDVGHAGGIFGASKGLQKDFGAARVFDTPISESAILGSAVGAALCGLKPIVEIMWADFMLVALDPLVNQAANVRYITGGEHAVPMVMRTQQGATPGSCAQHSQSLEALMAHIPGLKVGLPATPQDAYDMLREAAADPDPCLIFEARGLYPMKANVTRHGAVQAVGKAKLHKAGTDIAIVTWGPMLHQALAAAEALAAQGKQAAVLDLRWLSPLDETALLAAAHNAGGRVLIVHEAVRSGGFGGEVAIRLQELWSANTTLKVRRLTTPDVRIPAAPHLQAALIPNAADIARVAMTMI
jgi:2-oxoisovalerate dehydrogenase E1 component